MTFNVTEDARNLILGLKTKNNISGSYLRIGIKGEGCCGPKYDVSFVDHKTEDDFIFTLAGLTVIIDKKFEKDLDGAEIVAVKLGLETKFKINNPNVKSSCSCH